MTCEVTKIDPLKASGYEAAYYRIYFKRIPDGDWLQTDVVPIYRNFKNWKPVLEAGVGTVVSGLVLKSPNQKTKIDADSPVHIVSRPVVSQPTTIQDKLL